MTRKLNNGSTRFSKSGGQKNAPRREARPNAQINPYRGAQAHVEAAGSYYRALFDLAPVGYITTDEHGVITEMNRRAATLVGGTDTELAGRNLRFLIAPEDQATYRLTRNGLKVTGLSKSCQLRMKGVEDVAFWARLEMALVRIGNTKVFQIIIADITDCKLAELRLLERERQLQCDLAESGTLVREVHHRMKNNLQAILGLLSMQSELLGDDNARAALNESRRRLLSMAFVHERLYESEVREHIDFGEYTRALVNELFDSFSVSSGCISQRLNTSRVILNSDQAIPCGLILSELVTNALKYAYPDDQPGEVRVELDEDPSGLVTLAVSDDGVGLPVGFDWEQSHSMGLFIVASLVKQIGGILKIDSSPGASIIIQFPRQIKSRAPIVNGGETATALTFSQRVELPGIDPRGARLSLSFG